MTHDEDLGIGIKIPINCEILYLIAHNVDYVNFFLVKTWTRRALRAESLRWAVGRPPDPALWEVLVGPGEGARGRLAQAFFRLPYPAGSDENSVASQLRGIGRERRLLHARRRLRGIAKWKGREVLGALIARGDAVYRLEPGPRRHRLVGMSAGREGSGM